MAVLETWENDLNCNLINIPGYCKVSSMRSSGAKGGGTALFVKPYFKLIVIDVITVSFESVIIETMDLDKNVKTIIGTIYRRPGTNLSVFNCELEQVIGLFTKSKVNLILLGDYNINLLNHEVQSETADFVNLLYANTLLPLISKPTRYGEHSAILIDNVIMNMYSQNRLYHIILGDISDHYQSFWYLVMS